MSQGQTVLVDKLYRIRDKTAQTPAYSEHYTLFSLGQTVEKSQGCQEKVSLAREVPRYHVEYSESGGGVNNICYKGHPSSEDLGLHDFKKMFIFKLNIFSHRDAIMKKRTFLAVSLKTRADTAQTHGPPCSV